MICRTPALISRNLACVHLRVMLKVRSGSSTTNASLNHLRFHDDVLSTIPPPAAASATTWSKSQSTTHFNKPAKTSLLDMESKSPARLTSCNHARLKSIQWQRLIRSPTNPVPLRYARPAAFSTDTNNRKPACAVRGNSSTFLARNAVVFAAVCVL